jgi:hypothetical protein
MVDKHAVNVSSQIARSGKTPELPHRAHAVAMLVKESHLRVVLVVTIAGAGLHPHRAAKSVALRARRSGNVIATRALCLDREWHYRFLRPAGPIAS